MLLAMFRISITRARPRSSTERNCTVSTSNLTICHTTSRAFGKVSVTTSSAYESLVNEADVSNYINLISSHFVQESFRFFYNSNISLEQSQLVHQARVFLLTSIQDHLIYGCHQASVRRVVVCYQLYECKYENFNNLSIFSWFQ